MKKNYIQPTAKGIEYSKPLMIEMSSTTPAQADYPEGGDAKGDLGIDFDDDEED